MTTPQFQSHVKSLPENVSGNLGVRPDCLSCMDAADKKGREYLGPVMSETWKVLRTLSEIPFLFPFVVTCGAYGPLLDDIDAHSKGKERDILRKFVGVLRLCFTAWAY